VNYFGIAKSKSIEMLWNLKKIVSNEEIISKDESQKHPKV